MRLAPIILSTQLGLSSAVEAVRGILTASPKLSDHNYTLCPWNSLPVRERGPPPYVPPADRIYNTKGGPVEGKINVHLVPHSHDDTGWLITVDQYFQKEVYYIVDTVVDQLLRDENRKFMFVEIAFFSRWWDEQPEHRRNQTRTLVQEGRLEFINGGWCMHDEASPHYVEMVDQTTRGHQFLLREFGEAGIPKATWQIDPFGHSNTQAWLLGAESGMQSLFWGRMDYQDRNARKKQKKLEWIWEGSESLGSSARTFSGNLYGTGNGGYSTWMNFDGNGNQVQDNPKRHDYNIDQWVDKFVQDATKQAADTATDHQLWACGTDFQYQNADHWYHNLDKLIHYINQNGTVNAFYSTPTIYVEQKFKAGIKWEVRKQDDIFPLADNAHHYWTGYLTSRPALKMQVRKASNFMNAARQMEVLSGVTAPEVDVPTTRPSPEVGDSWTDSLEGTIAVATHHDAISGSPKQAVADDYEQRMSESSFEVEAGVALSLKKLLGVEADLGHCNCNTAGNCLNISVCAYTTNNDKFAVVAWNPLGQASKAYARLPVTGAAWKVTGPDGATVAGQVAPIDNRTYELPLLYINKAGLKKKDIEKAEKELSNKATHILTFPMSLEAVGYGVFAVSQSTIDQTAKHVSATSVSNGVYTLEFDAETNEVAKLSNKAGASTRLNLQWGWYNSSTGGCTVDKADGTIPALKCTSWRQTGNCDPNGPREPQNDKSCDTEITKGSGYCECEGGVKRQLSDCSGKSFTCAAVCVGDRFYGCDGQKSGAYMFRPNSSEVFFPGPKAKPTLQVLEGDVATEVYQTYSDWVSHVIRLYKDESFVEVEWTVGPIPVNTEWLQKNNSKWGKEVILRYNTGLDSKGTFYTDSNGREMVKRQYNKRPSSYPELVVTEPVAGNYYPINAMASIDDGKTELAVLTELTQGGASLKSGSIEMMVHRRIQQDDSRGVAEPLDETMCGCRLQNKGCDCAGLTMRGRHWLILDTVENANQLRRTLSERQNFGPTLAFGPSGLSATKPTFSALTADLPENVKLQTLTNNYASLHDGKLLFRLTHLYSVGEHPTLSQPVQVDLSTLFGSGYSVADAEEMSASAAQNKAEMEKQKYDWKTDGEEYPAGKWVPTTDLKVTLRPMEVKTFLVTFVKEEKALI
jgi:alpha-mannosidase